MRHFTGRDTDISPISELGEFATDEEIAQERKKALTEVKNEISDISVEIAEKVVGREIREEDHREMIDQFIRDLEDESRV